MRGQLKELNVEMWKVLLDPRATRLERLESARIIAALHGIFVASGIGEGVLSAKAAVQLRAAQAEIAERLFKRKQRKRGQNQRAYLRRQIREQEQKNMEANGSAVTGIENQISPVEG
jgi:type II secretory pathway component PulL